MLNWLVEAKVEAGNSFRNGETWMPVANGKSDAPRSSTKPTFSWNEPMPLVNVEFHGAVVAHLQQERLAVVLMLYVHALHDFENLQRLFAKSN